MDRRRVLAAVIAVGSLSTAGCLGRDEDGGCSGDWSPSVGADEPTLVPGEETTVRIEVTDVVGLSLTGPVSDDDIEMDVTGAASPPPDRTADTYPPKWYWSDCTDVDVAVPVSVAEDARPGEYEYGVHLVQSRDGSGESRDRTFTITVTRS